MLQIADEPHHSFSPPHYRARRGPSAAEEYAHTSLIELAPVERKIDPVKLLRSISEKPYETAYMVPLDDVELLLRQFIRVQAKTCRSAVCHLQLSETAVAAVFPHTHPLDHVPVRRSPLAQPLAHQQVEGEGEAEQVLIQGAFAGYPSSHPTASTRTPPAGTSRAQNPANGNGSGSANDEPNSKNPARPRLIVVGDTHGQLRDVLWIFSKYGLPSPDNVYLFNGDIVDRGTNAIAIFSLLFAFKIASPESIYLNRGNHEDERMNDLHGFSHELLDKFGPEVGRRVYDKFMTAYRVLPLVTVVNGAVMVTHGGMPRCAEYLKLEDLAEVLSDNFQQQKSYRYRNVEIDLLCRLVVQRRFRLCQSRLSCE